MTRSPLGRFNVTFHNDIFSQIIYNLSKSSITQARSPILCSSLFEGVLCKHKYFVQQDLVIHEMLVSSPLWHALRPARAQIGRMPCMKSCMTRMFVWWLAFKMLAVDLVTTNRPYDNIGIFVRTLDSKNLGLETSGCAKTDGTFTDVACTRWELLLKGKHREMGNIERWDNDAQWTILGVP